MLGFVSRWSRRFGAGLAVAVGIVGAGESQSPDTRIEIWGGNPQVQGPGSALALEVARRISPLRPVDPDPTLCCLVGTCCRTSILTGNQVFLGKAMLESTASQALSAQQNDLSQCLAPAVDAPTSVRRSVTFYARSAHFAECTAAAKRLLGIRTKGGSYTIELREIASTKEEREAYSRALSDYSNACLAPLGSNEAAAALRPSTIAKIEDAVGYLYVTPEAPFCTAFIAGAKIVTARHCFNAKGSLAINHLTRFRTFSGNHDVSVFLSREIHGESLEFRSVADDWIVLDTSEHVATSSIDVGEASQWDDLLVPAFDSHRLLLKVLGAEISTVRGPQLDLSPLCRVAFLDGPFIWHACQTESGFSGSPLLAVDRNERIRVVGLQAGGSERLGTGCQAALARFFPNYGVSLPRETVEKLQRSKR